MFITLEGIEGCGKSTQAKLLADSLQASGYETLLTREPGGPEISEHIRKILLDENNSRMFPETELLLYLASRAQHTAEWIIPALQKKMCVVCDRYTDSTVAYQGGGRELDTKTLLELTRFASYNLSPDITFLIDIPVTLAMQRIAAKKHDRLEQESNLFYEKVRERFLSVAKKDKRRYIIINGDDSVESIHHRIASVVLQKIKEGK